MILIQDFADIGAVTDPDLRCLIQARLDELRQYEVPLASLAKFIIIQPGDTLADIDTCLGFPILSNRWTGIRYGQPGFTPCWEIIEEHPHCYELVFVISDDGYGIEVFIPKQPDINAELLAMCNEYTGA